MPAGMERYARKPIFAREGAGVTLRSDDGTVISESDAGGYGGDGYVVQGPAPAAALPGRPYRQGLLPGPGAVDGRR